MFVRSGHKAAYIVGTIGAAWMAFWILRACFVCFDISGGVANVAKWFVPGIFSLYWYRFSMSFGLYIENQIVFFKGFRRKVISVADIYAIKIAESVTWAANGTGIGLRDKEGNKLYTMILVKKSPNKNSDLLEDLKKDLSDHRFMIRNERCVLCSCVYDQSAIDYLLTLNPNIIVF